MYYWEKAVGGSPLIYEVNVVDGGDCWILNWSGRDDLDKSGRVHDQYRVASPKESGCSPGNQRSVDYTNERDAECRGGRGTLKGYQHYNRRRDHPERRGGKKGGVYHRYSGEGLDYDELFGLSKR